MAITRKVIRMARDSLGVIIPKAVAQLLEIGVGDKVEIQLRKVVEGGSGDAPVKGWDAPSAEEGSR